jgi:cystathionine gamma-synthase
MPFMQKKTGLSTKANSAANQINPRSIIPPIYQTAIFPYPIDDAPMVHGHPLRYSREDNPTVLALEGIIKRLESDDERAESYAFSSGMAAISSLFFSKLKPGSTLLLSSEVYSLTLSLANNLTKFGVKVKAVKGGQLIDNVTTDTTMVFAEVMSNPTLNVIDVPALAERCARFGAYLALDNTFTTPVNFRPLDYGAQASVSSATKFLAGHNDVIAGAIVGLDIDEVWNWRRMLGGIIDPHAAYLVERGIKTLKVRVEAEQASAMKIAETLTQDKRIKAVFYPGLPSHPSHEVARRILRGYGAVLSFELKGGETETLKFMRELKVIRTAPSLGGTESLAMHPASAFGGAMSKQELQNAGISESLVRLSVGLEETEDLIWDIKQALDKAVRV